MTTLDYGRKNDIEDLYLHVKNAKSSSERNYWQKLINKILNESKATRELREKLLRAVHSDDRQAVRFYSDQLERLQQEELHGHYFQRPPTDT